MIASLVAGRSPGRSGWVRVNCPLCVVRTGKGDSRQSMGVSFASGWWHCFRCGSRGKLEGSFDEQPHEHDSDEPAPIEPPEGFIELFGVGETAVSLRPARDYVLRTRKVDPETARAAGIGACMKGKFAGRVVVPIRGEEGEWLWYVGRRWAAKCERPYLYPCGSRRGLLYNAGALRAQTDEPVLVVEGVFDAIAHWPNAVAVLGKPTDDHLEALAAATRPVVVFLDGDAADEALALAYRLHLAGQRVGVVQPWARVDPDELSRDEVRQLAREAIAHA